MERSIDDTDYSECHYRQIYREWSVRRDNRFGFFCLYEYYLEWLNELVGSVVNGTYEKLFSENPNLQGFIERNLDDPQSTEIMNKLNHDQELVVENKFIDFQTCFL